MCEPPGCGSCRTVASHALSDTFKTHILSRYTTRTSNDVWFVKTGRVSLEIVQGVKRPSCDGQCSGMENELKEWELINYRLFSCSIIYA